MATQRNSRNNSRSNDRNGKDEQRKHSGAKTGSDKNGHVYTTGWNYSKRFGLVTFLCVPYAKTKKVVSERGRTWLNVMVKVTKKMSKPEIVSGMMDFQTGAVTVQDLGIVINPKAPNGGYCGTYNK